MRSENCILCHPSYVLYQFPTWYRTIASHEQLYNYSFFYSSHVLLCQRRGKKMRYGPKSWRIGFATQYALRTMEAEMVVSRCGFIPEKVSKFFRFQLHDNIIHNREYSRTMKANSYTVSYSTEPETGTLRFGMVQYFLELTYAEKCSVIAIVDQLIVTSRVLDVQHISVLNASNSIEAINAQRIML